MIAVGTLTALYISSLLAIPASTLCYLWYRGYYKEKDNPTSDYNKSQREPAQHPANEVGLEYHQLLKYIELLEDESSLEI